MKATRALEALNFFVSDVQAGIGPFLGVFLQARGWGTDLIGTVMTIGGIAGMLATSPAGALVDSTRHKRALIVVAGLMTVAASGLLWVSHDYWMVAASQVATAVTGAAIGPAMAGITLGIVRQRGFDRQFGRNQVANHAGNVVAAALSGWLGWRYGFGAVFALSAAFGVLSLLAVAMIPGDAINHDLARGLGSDDSDHSDAGAKEAAATRVSGLRILVECRPLIVLALALMLFHLGNAAMLPLYGLAIVAAHQGDPSAFTAETIVIAQLVMTFAAMAAYRLIRWRGYWWVILITFLALPLRGMIAASVIHQWGVWPVQALDGIGAGLQSVAVPALVVRLLEGTGRVNAGQGVVMTMQGVGAALSPALGGIVAHRYGYPVAFVALGAIATGSLVLWLSFGAGLRHACHAGAGSNRHTVDTQLD